MGRTPYMESIDDVAKVEMPGWRRREARNHVPIRIAWRPVDRGNPPLDRGDADLGTSFAYNRTADDPDQRHLSVGEPVWRLRLRRRDAVQRPPGQLDLVPRASRRGRARRPGPPLLCAVHVEHDVVRAADADRVPISHWRHEAGRHLRSGHAPRLLVSTGDHAPGLQ